MKITPPSTLSLIALCAVASAALAQGTDWGPSPADPRVRSSDGSARHEGAPEMRRPPRPPIIAALDANSDGVLDADEIADAAKALLTLDANADGQLSGDEIHPPRPDGDQPGQRGQVGAGQRGGGGCQQGGAPAGSSAQDSRPVN